MKIAKPGAKAPPGVGPAAPASGWIMLGGVALAGAALLAYINTFRVPFVFDDLASIPGNATIRSLGQAWWPPKGQGGSQSRAGPC